MAIVELMACQSFPPATHDVLNDVYPGFKAADITERPWMGAVGTRTRPISHERLLPINYASRLSPARLAGTSMNTPNSAERRTGRADEDGVARAAAAAVETPPTPTQHANHSMAGMLRETEDATQPTLRGHATIKHLSEHADSSTGGSSKLHFLSVMQKTYMERHQTFAQEAARWGASHHPHRPVVFLGDSIIANLRRLVERQPELRAAVRDGLLSTPALFLGISNDCTQHLLWRLSHGELPPPPSLLATDAAATFVLCIGTNNLYHGYSADETAAGVMAAAAYVLDHSAGRLLVVSVLPRTWLRDARNPVDAVNETNAALRRLVRGAHIDGGKYAAHRLRVADCGEPFDDAVRRVIRAKDGATSSGRASIADAARQAESVLNQDGVHPTPAGYKKLVDCVARELLWSN